jgi:hypothetical protein
MVAAMITPGRPGRAADMLSAAAWIAIPAPGSVAAVQLALTAE